jgi:hypothetical protein
MEFFKIHFSNILKELREINVNTKSKLVNDIT